MPAESVKCVLVAKSPGVQVWGNDVRVGSAFSGTGANTLSNLTGNGSWGEYSVIAPGTITKFGSASDATGQQLTFANTPSSGSFTSLANSAGLGTIPDVKTYLEKAGNAEYAAKTGIHLEKTTGDVTISGYTANKVVIATNPSGTATVTITGDIINSSTGNTLSQMVIIASKINILPTVRQVDAWLIATDTLNTCYLTPPDTPKLGNCGTDSDASTLHINGPIMAKSLVLNRTGGADTGSAPAAEIINLRGDAYIWMHTLSSETGTIRTVYSRELAPRY